MICFWGLIGCAKNEVAAQITSQDSETKYTAESTNQNITAKEIVNENDDLSIVESQNLDDTLQQNKAMNDPNLNEESGVVEVRTIEDEITENKKDNGSKIVDNTQGQDGSKIEACLVKTHYAGDVLEAADFYIKITKADGTIIENPLGWHASPLELLEGENKISVSFEGCSTVITVNAGLKPEGVDEKAKNGDTAQPVVIVNKEAFSVSGPSVLTETQDMGQEYLDKIVFLGDSRTYSYKAYGVLSGGKKTTQVWTPKNGTMTLSAQSYVMISYPETGKDMTIRDAVALKKPEYLMIGLGTNGISYMNEEDFRNEYLSLINDIKSISPDTKIIINSMFPIAHYYKRLDLINNQKIAEGNRWLVKIAEEAGVKFLNTAEALADENGWLNINYDNGGEATHLNRQGNEIVMRYIRTHGYQ